MSFKTFRKLNTSDRIISQLQDNIGATLQPIIANTALDSQILTGIVLTAGVTNQVPHMLGRKLQGWNLVRLRGNSTVYDSQDTNTAPDKFLSLHCTNTVTVDISVF